MDNLKAKITGLCQMHGLTLQRNATQKLLEYLSSSPETAHQNLLEKIIEQLQQQDSDTPTIHEHAVLEAIDTIQSSSEKSRLSNVFNVIDAFAIPKFKLDGERKKYIKSTEVNRLFGVASMKADMYINRYNVIYRRLIRHCLFKPSVAGDSGQGQKFVLRPVEYLLGSASSVELGNIVVFGLLTQLKEGKYYLEDPSGAVLLDLTNAKYESGLFTEGCFVLAEGIYGDRVFHVSGLGFPPSEPSQMSREVLGNINVFGGKSETAAKYSSRLKAVEEEYSNASFVFIADVWLDDIKVMNKLRKLFEGFSQFPPTCFVFIGNFHSSSTKMSSPVLYKSLRECFQKLAQMIMEFKSLADSKFVFVPGPQDPESPEIIPRFPIPKYISKVFCDELRSRDKTRSDEFPGAVFTTNPCRLQFCTKEIVIFREDLVTKMCRNCIHVPTGDPIPTHFAKTLTSQFCLSPIPIQILPVYWEFDHVLSLFPLPDLIVCADKYHPFSEEHSGCQIVNPGSFSLSNYVFKVYLPSKGLIEDSQIPDD